MVRTLTLALFVCAAPLAGCRGVFGIEDPVDRGDAMPSSDAALDAAVAIDAPATPANIQFVGHGNSLADGDIYTFLAVPLGAPVTGRHAIVVTHSYSSAGVFAPASVTIGGDLVTTRTVSAGETAAGGAVAIYIAAIPDTRTANDIVLAFTGVTGDRIVSIGAWVAYGLTSTTPVDVEVVPSGTGTSTIGIDVPAGGVLVGGATIGGVGGAPGAAWTGLSAAYSEIAETTLVNAAAANTTVAETRTLMFAAQASSQRIVAASFR